MNKSLFVAGIEYSITDAQLKKIFEEHGNVTSAKIITDKFTGQSRGFGFVDMASVEEAQTCINVLNEASVNGKTIVVKFKEDKPAGSTGSNSGARKPSNFKPRW